MITRILLLIACLPILLGVNDFGDANHSAIDVSVINLIATPDAFHGKVVRVIGVSNFEFEGNHLWFCKEHWANPVVKN